MRAAAGQPNELPTPAIQPPQASLILYEREEDRTRIQCRFESMPPWLTQALIYDLLPITVPTVNEYLKGISADGKWDPGAPIREFRMVRKEASREVSREIEHYNLPAKLDSLREETCGRGSTYRQKPATLDALKKSLMHQAFTGQPQELPMPENQPPQSSLILYQTEDGRTRIQCRFENETVWLTQKLMAELFGKDVRTVNEHIRNVFAERELAEGAVIRKFRITAADGKTYLTQHYSLEAVIAVGYRVKSPRGTQFRQWATARLNEYLVKGFTMDDERLKNPTGQGHTDRFDELLERIRDIRASERRVYLRVREILALAADYAPSEPTAQACFQTVQNKLHFAATGKTAPELIAERADSAEANMGLTAWKSGAVRKGDVTVAKNYLREAEINELNRIVVMFLDFAEDQARRRKQIFLNTWQTRLDDFLRLNERSILPDGGRVSRERVDAIAEQEYDRFAARRRARLEDEAEADTFKQLEDEVKKLPEKNKRKPPKP